MFGYG